MATRPKTALEVVQRRRAGEALVSPPEADDRLMRRLRSDRLMSTPAQLYRESESRSEDPLRLRDAPPPPPGYRYTLDGRLIPVEGSELPITDPDAQQLFCDVIEITGSMRAAADALGIRSLPRVKGYLMKDPDFAECVEAAAERHRESLMAHAIQRATVGVQNPIFSKDGDLLGYETKHSDGLLKLLLERHFPELRRGGVTVNNNTQNNVTVEGDMITQARAMTREQRDVARQLLRDKTELPPEDEVIDVPAVGTESVDGDAAETVDPLPDDGESVPAGELSSTPEADDEPSGGN